MSAPIFFSWRQAVLASRRPATTKHVLLTLSCHMNDAGESCFPFIDTLARETSLSRRAVIDHVGRAAAAGWIDVGRHGFAGQKWARNEYRIAWHDPVPGGQEGGSGGSPPCPEGGEGGSPPFAEGGDSDGQKAVTLVHPNSSSNSSVDDGARAIEADEASSEAGEAVARFLACRAEHFPSESRLPAPGLTLLAQARRWLAAGLPLGVLLDTVERGVVRMAARGVSAPGSLAVFEQSLGDALVRWREAGEPPAAGLAGAGNGYRSPVGPGPPWAAEHTAAWRRWVEGGRQGPPPDAGAFERAWREGHGGEAQH